MNLSKTFDYISHDLIIARLAAYGRSLNDVKLRLSYWSDCHQCVKLNKIHNNLLEIVSSLLQGLIHGLILSSLSMNDLFFFIEKASIENFADANFLSAWAKISRINT